MFFVLYLKTISLGPGVRECSGSLLPLCELQRRPQVSGAIVEFGQTFWKGAGPYVAFKSIFGVECTCCQQPL